MEHVSVNITKHKAVCIGHLLKRICLPYYIVSDSPLLLSVLALGLPAQVEEVCPLVPSLEKSLEEIMELAESGMSYTQMPHVMEVVLPMLCSYMSRWWDHGPENNPERTQSCCTSLTSNHMNTLLGNILKIIYNNLGIDEGAWMKRLAGRHSIIEVISLASISLMLICDLQTCI